MTEIEAYVPAEDILEKISKQDVFFMFPSATMLSLDKIKCKVYVFKFSALQNNKRYLESYEQAAMTIRNNGVDYEEVIL